MMNVASTGRVDHDKDGWDCYTNERLLFAESWGHRRVGQPQLWRLGCVTGEVANFYTRNLNRRGNDRGKWRKTIPEAKTRPGLSSLLLLLLLLLLLMTFMQCIHNYVRETNHVSWVQFWDRPLLKFMLLVMLFPLLNILYLYSYIRTVRSVCTVPHVAVFCSSLKSCFPDMLLRYFLNDSEMTPVTSIEISIIFVFTLLLLLHYAQIIPLSSCAIGFSFVISSFNKT